MPASRHKNPERWTFEEWVHWAVIRKASEEVEIALVAADDLAETNHALQFGNARNRDLLEARLWAAVETFLLTTSKLSELFRTPAVERRPDRRVPERLTRSSRDLRARRFSEAFGVGAASPLHVARVRNGFVHFFERYEALIRSGMKVRLSDRGRVSLYPERFSEDRWSLRNVDPTTLEISYLGQTVDTHAVVAELRRLQGEFIDRLPTAKKDIRFGRKARARARALQSEYGDLPSTVMPEDWDTTHSRAQVPESVREMIDLFADGYNQMVRSRRAEDFAMLFDVHGELNQQRSRLRSLDGRKEILTELSKHPPRRRLWLGPTLVETQDRALLTYGWSQLPQGEEGILRLSFSDGKITQALFRAIPGRVGVVTTGRSHQYGRNFVHHTFRA